jgi:hypothetical protein
MRERQFPSEQIENRDENEKQFSDKKTSKTEIDEMDDERQNEVGYYIGCLKMQLIASTIMEITRQHIIPLDKLQIRNFCDK